MKVAHLNGSLLSYLRQMPQGLLSFLRLELMLQNFPSNTNSFVKCENLSLLIKANTLQIDAVKFSAISKLYSVASEFMLF